MTHTPSASPLSAPEPTSDGVNFCHDTSTQICEPNTRELHSNTDLSNPAALWGTDFNFYRGSGGNGDSYLKITIQYNCLLYRAQSTTVLKSAKRELH